ncbi:MAG: 16S rRNA (uracil(1498)-N(3))-methyltransferase [Methanomicrobia archaeon]|nr:16S rRNA (uracil(1498)-N(3))-methyltransferase [Methanomicrobia archaeon]
MQRYFGQLGEQETVILADDDIFHLTKVMRARNNQHLEVVIDGMAYDVVIERLQPLVLKRLGTLDKSTELPNNITLYYGMPKGEKLDMVIQKATELGVSKIVLLMSKRSIVRIEEKDKSRKLERYQKIAKEASEQSKRTVVPIIEAMGEFDLIKQAQGAFRFIADEEVAGVTSMLSAMISSIKPEHSIDILIGPEGGFDRSEVTLAQAHGFVPVSLGKRILRSETAVLYFMSILSYSLERK